jgi:hypothetical protein
MEALMQRPRFTTMPGEKKASMINAARRADELAAKSDWISAEEADFLQGVRFYLEWEETRPTDAEVQAAGEALRLGSDR